MIIRPDEQTTHFDDQTEQKVPPANVAQKRALRKDAHLLAAANRADRVLLTTDVALQDLCEKYDIQPHLEWLIAQPSWREKLEARLLDLATTRPNPPLPAKT